MEEKLSITTIAGLLHDIGKFALRAGVSGNRIWDTAAKQDFGHKHAMLTDDFVERCVPTQWRAAVRSAAGSHHRPSNRGDYAVALADHLSAGERDTPEEDETKIQPKQLLSIFCSIEADGKQAPKSAFWPLEALRLEESVLFPGSALPAEQVAKQYSRLWDSFFAEAQALASASRAEDASADMYLESLQLLLQRYAWCIPSAYYRTRPDVSLYDHARITGALSALLDVSSLSTDQLQDLVKNARDSNEPVALLVGGDLSGIQDFLYTISARGATSALRGRSFYLQLLTEAAARYTLSRLGLPITNLLYLGGGNFYLLARSSDQQALEEIQKEIGKVLFAAHRGDLYLGLGSVLLKARDFFDGSISRRWGNLSEELQQSKLHRFAGLGEELPAIFQPEGHGGNQEQSCSVCGSEDPHPTVEQREGSEEVRKCQTCASFETLGDDLRSAEFLVLTLCDPSIPAQIQARPPLPYSDVLHSLGMQVELTRDPPKVATGEKRVVLALSDKAMSMAKPAARQAVGRRMMVNVTPLITDQEIKDLRDKMVPDLPAPGSIKPFHVMEYQSDGVRRIGILRMDVDNLGHIFSEGLGKSATLSRVAALSFATSLYFEGWVEKLGEQINQECGDRLYSIYAGGDDLFFVGSWNAVVELARRARSDLSRFACNHPGIHASAGIVLTGGKFPLAEAAVEAGKAEGSAKGWKWFDDKKEPHQKDALTFLGQTCPWQRFGLEPEKAENFDTVHGLMRFLVTREKLHPLLQRLIQFQEMYQDEVHQRQETGRDQTRSGEPQVLYGRWNWLAEYTLKRVKDQTKNPDIEMIRKEISKDKFNSIEWIGLAARWAELETRKE